MLGHKRLSRFKLPRPLTPWDTGAYDPYTVIPISLCSAGIHSLIGINSHALRMRVERTFAWEDKFKRLLLRFERIQQRHYGMKLMAYTLINLRAFCGV